jgi:hypothetical protein
LHVWSYDAIRQLAMVACRVWEEERIGKGMFSRER